MVEELVDPAISLNLQGGIVNSLIGKSHAAISCFDEMNENSDIAAINSLDASIHAVEAQSGDRIPTADADALIAEALLVISKLQAE